jgi:hypothetical protein
LSFRPNNPTKSSLETHAPWIIQGEQIGRVFARWVPISLGSFLKISKNSKKHF